MIITLAPFLSTVRTIRSAVVPYCVNETGIHFLLGIDRRSGDVTDIGGGVKTREFALDGAERELNEETIGIFKDHLGELVMHKSIALYDGKSRLSSIFLPVNEGLYRSTVDEFDRRQKATSKKTHNEMERLMWVNGNEFKSFVRGEKQGMWKKVKTFYSKAFDDKFVKLLEDMY